MKKKKKLIAKILFCWGVGNKIIFYFHENNRKIVLSYSIPANTSFIDFLIYTFWVLYLIWFDKKKKKKKKKEEGGDINQKFSNKEIRIKIQNVFRESKSILMNLLYKLNLRNLNIIKSVLTRNHFFDSQILII